jgi:hypothetical protein
MQRLVLMLFIASMGWIGYSKYEAGLRPAQAAEYESPPTAAPVRAPGFKCDGRTYCSRMTSCAEATFVLRNCPGVKMDGDGNGIPCERQWCGR